MRAVLWCLVFHNCISFTILIIFVAVYLSSTKVVAVGTKGKEKDKDAGLTTQIKGTTMIRKLCRVVMNLEQVRLHFDCMIIQHRSSLASLSLSSRVCLCVVGERGAMVVQMEGCACTLQSNLRFFSGSLSVCVCVCVCLSQYFFVYLSTYLSVALYLSVWLSSSFSICLSLLTSHLI